MCCLPLTSSNKAPQAPIILFKDRNDEDCVLLVNYALVDCACPTTVAGQNWIMKFIGRLSMEDKQKVKLFKSQKVFKFGGGERRNSKCILEFPCCLGGLNIKLRSEVIDADLPLLLGNNSLEKAEAILDIGKRKIQLFNKILSMSSTSSHK